MNVDQGQITSRHPSPEHADAQEIIQLPAITKNMHLNVDEELI